LQSLSGFDGWRRLRVHDLAIDRGFHHSIDIDPSSVVDHPDPNPFSLIFGLDPDASDLLLPRSLALFRTFDSVIHCVSHQVKKRLAEHIDNSSVELRISRPYPHLDRLPERVGELTCVTREIPQKRFQRLNLETKKGLELPFAEPTEDPLSGFELHRHLTQRDRQGREDLLWIAFADTPLGQRCEPEDPIREPLRCHRHDSQTGAAIREVVDDSGSYPKLFTTAMRAFGCAAFQLRCYIRTDCWFFANVIKGLHQRPQLITDRQEFAALRRCWAFELVLREVARVSNLPKTHHPAGSLEGVEFSPKLSRSLFVVFKTRDQLENPIQTLAGFFEKECAQVVVRCIRIQIFVQFKRLTSTPRMPTISLSAFRTATAIVKQGSSVKSDS
jgi:hypothetical protein